MISPATIEAVKQATDLAGLVSEYATLMKSGSDHVARCPFHSEKTASFRVHSTGERKGQFFCFGCGAKGGVYDFIIAVNGWGTRDFYRVVEMLADRAGIPLEDDKQPKRSPIQRAADAEDVECCQWWWKQKWNLIRAELDIAIPVTEMFPVDITWTDGVMKARALRPAPESYLWADCLGRMLRKIEQMPQIEKMQEFRAYVTGAERKAFRVQRDELRAFDRFWMELAGFSEAVAA